VIESAAYREERIKEYSAKLARAARQAVALETSERQERERADALSVDDDTRLWALAVERAKRIHHERCRAIRQAADLARGLVELALGDLTIDTSTTHTGLDEDERLLVSEVSGRGR
jgi:hypothetical protein